jgi:hypothetical protein
VNSPPQAGENWYLYPHTDGFRIRIHIVQGDPPLCEPWLQVIKDVAEVLGAGVGLLFPAKVALGTGKVGPLAGQDTAGFKPEELRG